MLDENESYVYDSIMEFGLRNHYLPSIEQISAETGYAYKTVQNYMRRLKEKGYIRYKAKKGTHVKYSVKDLMYIRKEGDSNA